jgi:tellurite resistance protein
MDLIEVLPPGLYEMVIEDKTPEAVGAELLPGQYLVRFEGRTVEDILKLGDGREHEQAFETVARISEINEGLYDTFLSPWIKMWSNEATAEALRMMHPLRLQRFLLSDLNPAIWPLRILAEMVRNDRRPAAADNALIKAEHAVSDQIEQALDRYREARDRLQELTFKTIYNSPLVEALAGLRAPLADARKARARNEALDKQVEAKIAAIRSREGQGGFAEAVVRIMLAGAKAQRMIDARGFRLAQQLASEHPRLKGLGHERLKAIAKEEAFMIRFDEEHALASLPELLPSEAERREAVTIARQVGRARGELSAEGEALLDRIERVLGLEPETVLAPEQPARKSAPQARKRPAAAKARH